MSECDGIIWNKNREEELKDLKFKAQQIEEEKKKFKDCFRNKLAQEFIFKRIIERIYSDYSRSYIYYGEDPEVIKGNFLIDILIDRGDEIVEIYNKIKKDVNG